MWETIYSGEAVEIDITQGEDFEQSWTFDDEGVVIPFITEGWDAKAAISDRTGKVWTENMPVVLADDGSATVSLGRDKTISLAVGTHIWTLVFIEPGTGNYNVVFNAPARIHAGAVKSIE
jgi:hypothetical protein